REPGEARAGLESLRVRLAAAAAPPAAGAPPAADAGAPPAAAAPVSSFARDAGEAAAALATVGPDDRLVGFSGKLITSKAVALLLAAGPQVLAREPRARLVVVGFGAFRDGLERLAGALAAGDLAAARATRGEDGQALPRLQAHLAAADLAPVDDLRVAFAGR